MLTPEYLAGLFDGEGNVEITNKLSLRLGLTNTFKPVLDLVQQQFGGSIKSKTRHSSQARIGYVWRPCGNRARTFLRCIQPFVIIKKDQVTVGLALPCYGRGHKKSQEEKSYCFALQQEIRTLNKRGERQ